MAVKKGTAIRSAFAVRTAPTPDALQAAYRASLEALNSAELAHSSFWELEALFGAIRAAAEKETSEHRLAGLGGYLCDSWAWNYAAQIEELRKRTDELQEMLKSAAA